MPFLPFPPLVQVQMSLASTPSQLKTRRILICHFILDCSEIPPIQTTLLCRGLLHPPLLQTKNSLLPLTGFKYCINLSNWCHFPLIDKWQWWGGIPAFCRIHGAPESQFFTNKSIVSNFLNVVRYVATRQNMFTGREYRHEPFIYAWETGNELSAGKERVPTEWTLAVTRLLKNELAASQLIFDGSYSLYGWDDAVLNDASIDGFTGHYYQQNPVEAPRTVNRVAGIIFGFSAVFLLVAVWLVHRSKISIDTFKRIPFFAEAPADANQEDSRPDEALMDSYEPRQSKVAKWQSLGGLILISIIILTSFALSINQSPKYLPSLDYASRFQLDHDLIVTQHKKLFFVGEYGLDSVPVFERLLEAVENSNAMGALIWSLRFRSRNGGFYSMMKAGDSFRIITLDSLGPSLLEATS
ncbi:hypothetical protein BCR33DRAFT_236645 [Rhizoclosmatium globosum]|uniref:mannan endo-1,4-beta-mannosidase n=1 Tax=Rhizoclosmatium globosum TaxID=329046 RepID=A0A1Y2CAU6_9FUNG|nr:hypothetical protein BCR33DRAFT_236645 [Rhizoclosmatium globosum]|eukprot:ORY44162.1 hypothetical protein BCR33DRAFT_236645 [Rhizoclosmatium globosum]